MVRAGLEQTVGHIHRKNTAAGGTHVPSHQKTVRRNFGGVEYSAKLAELEHQQLDANRISREHPTLAILNDGRESYYQAVTGQCEAS